MRLFSTLFLMITLAACSSSHTAPDAVYVNNNQTCSLALYPENEYRFTYPMFWAKDKNEERGRFQIENDKLLLISDIQNHEEDTYLSYTCFKDSPTSVLVSFETFNKEKIDAKFSINGSAEILVTDSGKIELFYDELAEKGFIMEGGRIENITIFCLDKEYIYDMEYYKNSRKPDRLLFSINEFKDEEYALLKRSYSFKNDSIRLNDIDPKLTGLNYRVMIKQ